jgi:hypothetical protein
VDRLFSVDEARELLPDVLARADELIAPSQLGGLAEAKAMEARLSELLGWFSAQGLQVKGLAPLLLDFPAQLGDETVLLCWLEGERELGWYHLPEHGFAGRRRLAGSAGQGGSGNVQ